MSRLADLVEREGFRLAIEGPTIEAQLRADFAQAQVIVIDNVADYYFVSSGRAVQDWTLLDFPNVAPPFDVAFFEFRPRSTWSDAPPRGPVPQAVGVLTQAIPLQPGEAIVPGYSVAPDARWWVLATTLVQWSDEPRRVQAMPPMMFHVGADGRMLWDATTAAHPFAGWLPPDVDQPGGWSAERWQEQFCFLQHHVIHPVLLAISFMHCRNVARVAVTPPPKLSRSHERKYGAPLVTYTTLAIDPMREVLRREGGSEQHGLARALHLCRGHFAHYDERPLFGKVRGTFWKPMHVRGSGQHGITLKDYDVQPGRAS